LCPNKEPQGGIEQTEKKGTNLDRRRKGSKRGHIERVVGGYDPARNSLACYAALDRVFANVKHHSGVARDGPAQQAQHESLLGSEKNDSYFFRKDKNAQTSCRARNGGLTDVST
jgi:hypothetical protein